MGDWKNRVLARQISNLIKSRGVDFYLSYYANNINAYDKNQGKKFTTTELEVDDFIKDIPELQPENIREQLIKLTRNARIKAGLGE